MESLIGDQHQIETYDMDAFDVDTGSNNIFMGELASYLNQINSTDRLADLLDTNRPSSRQDSGIWSPDTIEVGAAIPFLLSEASFVVNYLFTYALTMSYFLKRLGQNE